MTLPPQADHAAHDRAHHPWRHDLGNTLAVISARTRLQQRLTLRSSSLTDPERDQARANLEAVMTAVEELEIQIQALLRGVCAA